MRFENINSETEKVARENIIHDRSINMFVEAGAGAGKTYLIVERIMNLLANGVKPGEIVVITFTKAAAEELRGRIANKVREKHLDEAMKHLDEMNISTIHSFCNVLLKEQAVAAGLPVDIEIIEEDEDERIKTKALNKYLSSLPDEEWHRMQSIYPDGKTRKQIRDHISGIYRGILRQPDDIEIKLPDEKKLNEELNSLREFAYSADETQLNDLLERVQQKIVELSRDILPSIENTEDLINDEKLASDGAKKLCEVIGDSELPLLDKRNYLLNLAIGKKSNLWKKSNLTKEYNKDSVNSSIDSWREYLLKEFEDIINLSILADVSKTEDMYKNAWLSILTCHAANAADAYRETQPLNKVSNDRLLWLTKKLICNDSDDRALRYFSKKYKAFFVDEFQDTDSVQADFIYRLASDLNDPAHRKLRDGALFVVGDPKQSIYRFRGAQPEIYFDIKDRMADLSNAMVYELHNNFRTNKVLIDWINEKFIEADNVDDPMYIVNKDHPYVPMTPVKEIAKDEGKLIYGAYRFSGAADSLAGTREVQQKTKTKTEYIVADYSPENDVKDVVNVIKNLIDKEYKITDYKEKNGEKVPFSRAIKPSDFLLITHKKKDVMEPYLNALKAAGIPVKFEGDSKLDTDQILVTYMRIFRHLINPREPFYRVAAIEAIRESLLIDCEADMDEYADYLLDLLRDRVTGMTPYGAAQYLEKQLSAILPKTETGISSIDLMASMTRIRQMLENVTMNADGTGITLVKAMEEYINKGVEHELAMDEKADAVIFMNLHKTKGLEGKIVIIADREEQAWEKTISDYRDGNVYYPGYIYFKEKWCSAIGNTELKEKFVAESKAEFHRLEYVAVTRAEQAVIFMNTIKPKCIFANQTVDKDKGVSDGFDYKLRELRSLDCVDEDVVNVPAAPVTYDIFRDDLFSRKADVSLVDEGRYKALYDKQSPSLLEVKDKDRQIRKEVISESQKSGKTREAERSTAMKRPADNKVGNVLHRTMELMVGRYVAGADDHMIERIAAMCTAQAVHENEVDISHSEKYTKKEVADFIQACAVSYYHWIKEQKLLEGVRHIYTELPFSYYEEKEQPEEGDDVGKIFMKGNADLIIRYNDDRVFLIDYKSDVDYLVPEDRITDVFEEKYAPQLRTYRHMIEKLMGIPADRIKLGIVSFTQKDERGQLYPDRTVRIRFSTISVH